MTLKAKIVSGITWSALSRIAQEGVGLFTTFVLARLLSPDAFGLLGMVAVFTGFIAVFQNLGLGPSIVQDREISQEQLSGIFWLNLGFSVLLGLFTIGSAPFISRFYEEPAIIPIIMVLVVNFPVSALGMVPGALLSKRMAFKKIAFIQNTAMIAGSAAGITMAFMGLGVWALVLQQVISTLTRTLLQWITARWNPTWTLPYREIKKQLHFGINLQIGSLLNYGIRNVDDLLIGKFIGAAPLGVYQMAYRLMLWPLQKVSRVVGQVMFPALSAMQGDKERVKRAFLKATSSIALITFPMTLGMWVVARPAVYATLGEKWAGVIPIFRVLCILGLTQSLVTNTGWIFLSQGRTDVRLKLLIVLSILFITSFAIGINWGVMGVAVCYTITSLLVMPVQFHIAGKLINMTFGDVVRAVAGIFGCAVAMAAFVWGVGHILPTNLPHWRYLAVQVPVGVVLYVAMIRIFRLRAYQEVREIIYEQIQSKFHGSTCSSSQTKKRSDENSHPL